MREWIIGRPECRGGGREGAEVAVGTRAMGGFEVRGSGVLGEGPREVVGRLRCVSDVGGTRETIARRWWMFEDAGGMIEASVRRWRRLRGTFEDV